MSLFDLLKNKKDHSACADCACHNYSVEFSEDNPIFSSYISSGVMFDSVGDGLRLSYTGLLPKSGAGDIYAVVGLGDSNEWSEIRYYPMKKVTQNYYEVMLPIEKSSNINIAFKDEADNWDNNSGKNYTFKSR